MLRFVVYVVSKTKIIISGFRLNSGHGSQTANERRGHELHGGLIHDLGHICISGGTRGVVTYFPFLVFFWLR